jgi:flavin-dependent dehydrogenase
VAYSWPIPSLSDTDLRGSLAGAGRWLLVGDAAGLVDPITREGIYFALKSGELAARAILASPGAPALEYTDAVRRECVDELARAARLKAGFFRPGFTRLLTHSLEHSAPVRAIMAKLIAGEQPYRSLKQRLLLTCELRLAWRLAQMEIGSRLEGAHRAT